MTSEPEIKLSLLAAEAAADTASANVDTESVGAPSDVVFQYTLDQLREDDGVRRLRALPAAYIVRNPADELIKLVKAKANRNYIEEGCRDRDGRIDRIKVLQKLQDIMTEAAEATDVQESIYEDAKINRGELMEIIKTNLEAYARKYGVEVGFGDFLVSRGYSKIVRNTKPFGVMPPVAIPAPVKTNGISEPSGEDTAAKAEEQQIREQLMAKAEQEFTRALVIYFRKHFDLPNRTVAAFDDKPDVSSPSMLDEVLASYPIFFDGCVINVINQLMGDKDSSFAKIHDGRQYEEILADTQEIVSGKVDRDAEKAIPEIITPLAVWLKESALINIQSILDAGEIGSPEWEIFIDYSLKVITYELLKSLISVKREKAAMYLCQILTNENRRNHFYGPARKIADDRFVELRIEAEMEQPARFGLATESLDYELDAEEPTQADLLPAEKDRADDGDQQVPQDAIKDSPQVFNPPERQNLAPAGPSKIVLDGVEMDPIPDFVKPVSGTSNRRRSLWALVAAVATAVAGVGVYKSIEYSTSYQDSAASASSGVTPNTDPSGQNQTTVNRSAPVEQQNPIRKVSPQTPPERDNTVNYQTRMVRGAGFEGDFTQLRRQLTQDMNEKQLGQMHEIDTKYNRGDYGATIKLFRSYLDSGELNAVRYSPVHPMHNQMMQAVAKFGEPMKWTWTAKKLVTENGKLAMRAMPYEQAYSDEVAFFEGCQRGFTDGGIGLNGNININGGKPGETMSLTMANGELNPYVKEAYRIKGLIADNAGTGIASPPSFLNNVAPVMNVSPDSGNIDGGSLLAPDSGATGFNTGNGREGWNPLMDDTRKLVAATFFDQPALEDDYSIDVDLSDLDADSSEIAAEALTSADIIDAVNVSVPPETVTLTSADIIEEIEYGETEMDAAELAKIEEDEFDAQWDVIAKEHGMNNTLNA